MSRIGLVQLSNSARNSPYGVEKAPFEKSASSNKKNVPEPLKLTKKCYQPSPLSTSIISNSKITPVSSPFDVYTEEDTKENAETQTVFESRCTHTQTIITVPHIQPTITENDLTSEKPTVNYLRMMADRLQMDYDDEVERNERLVEELGDLDEKIGKIDDDMEILLEVLEDIDEEQMDDELGTTNV
uniref:Neogenin_C domain-containing protein n=1 Tax=Caenorhabditis tropicalis TaxID=1561998 RepID=A0A1I7U3Q9_9PELO